MISGDVLGERARLTPDALALVVVEPPLRLTYHQLDARAARCAMAWRRLGMRRGDRVAILAHNRVEYLDAFFAAGKSGVILVPLGVRLTAAELAPILADSGARLLLWDGELAATVAALRPLASGIERWVALDGVAGDGVAGDDGYAALVAEGEPSHFERARCEPEDVYCLLYTSGTTGTPKGVMIPHRQIAWNGYNTVCSWGLGADDVSPIFTPLYHAGGLMAFLGPIVTAGGTLVLHRGFDPAEIWRTIARERATVVLGVPTIWKLLAEAPEFAAADLSSIRCLYSGGAPLPAWLAETYQRRGLTFKQGFGMTEVGVNCFAMTAEGSARKPGSIGKPMMHTEVRLVDSAGRDVAAGEVGEMWLAGPHVSLGYWNRPAETAETYLTAGDGRKWLRSGDLARRDEEGFFYVAGRIKDLIISGGVNVYPAEIEAVLLQHPGVRDAAVVGVEHPTWGEVGIAFVVPVAPGSADAGSVLAFLGERLARFKLPKEVVTVAELPRTAYGKVVKGELRTGYLRGMTEPTPPPPSTPAPLTHRLSGPTESAAGSPLVLLNGGMMTFVAWEPVAARLRPRHQVLQLDFRGQLTSPGQGPADLAGHAAEVVALLDAVGWESAHLVGASFGAQVALELAAGWPERARSLVVATAMDRESAEFRRNRETTHAMLAEIAAGGPRERFWDAFTEDVYSTHYRQAEAAAFAARRAQIGLLPAAWFDGVDRLLRAIADFDLGPRLAAIRCPALVVLAGDDRVMSAERSQALATALGAEVAVHPTAGHALIVEEPDWLADRCLEFLARQDAAPASGS